MENSIKGGKFRGGGDSVSYTIVSEQGASVYRDGKMAGPRLRDPRSLVELCRFLKIGNRESQFLLPICKMRNCEDSFGHNSGSNSRKFSKNGQGTGIVILLESDQTNSFLWPGMASSRNLGPIFFTLPVQLLEGGDGREPGAEPGRDRRSVHRPPPQE